MLTALGNAVVPQQAAPVAEVIYRYVMKGSETMRTDPKYPHVFDSWWTTDEGQAIAEVLYGKADDWLTPTEAAKVLWGDDIDLDAGRQRLRYYVATDRLMAYAKPASVGYRYNDAQRSKRGSKTRSRTWVIRRADLEAFKAEYLPELMEESA